VSFAPITSLRPALVKVDGSVIRNLLAGEAAQTKLKAVLRVARSLGIGVVAECVEEQEQLARLKALDVAYAQGFGVAKPRPIEGLAATA
jgi:EAL domain-containing protein (putative c-di-GMP-specific phosphodiesterase class I)